MIQHVEKIAENLYALTARKMKPLVVVVDNKNNYISHHGELADYQLPLFEAGQSCVEVLPFLVGLEDEAYVSLPLVNFNEKNISSVNVININAHRYVVLLEAGDEHHRQQQATQDSNETKLLYQKLQQLTQQLEIANSVKSRFISGMSHEFRTPISSILGYSSLLVSKYTFEDNEYQHARAIVSSAQYLLSLIDNVLEHAQLEADKILINIAPFSVNELITNLQYMFGARSEKSDISFSLETSESLPEAVYSDQIRLQQILINIIGNAFKYTEAGSIVASFDWKDNKLIIKISDTGPGIPLEHQENIFQAYSRYDAVHKKGAGLGLAISAQIAEKLNGQLELESHLGKGSVFTLRVMAQPADLSSIKNTLLNDKAKHVLIVEDDLDLIELLKIYLQEFGYTTSTAIDGKEALQKCESENFDLVLLDMQLPVLNGIDIAKKLRAIKFHAPIIAMTASSNNEDKVLAMKAGCNEFLAKPIQLSPLMSAISNTLDNHA